MSDSEMSPASKTSDVHRLVMRLWCWWFGCDAHSQECYHRDDDMFQCMRCGDEASYSDMVGDTRHNRFKNAARYWLWRKWWPVKCCDCGHRFGCDESVDHIPF